MDREDIENVDYDYQNDMDSLEETVNFEDGFSSDELYDPSVPDDEENQRSPEARLWCNSNTPFFDKNNWDAIYKNIQKLGDLEHSVIWNDKKSLSLAQFAAGSLAYRLLSVRKWNYQQKTLSTEYRKCFLKLANRLIALDPINDRYRSSKAYFFYVHYISNHHDENDYQNAFELLKDLAETPTARFKDAQRYIRLRQKKHEGFNQKDDNELLKLIADYDALIEIYESLNQREQSRCEKNFISCEYNYVKINAQYLWKETLSPYFMTVSSTENRSKLENWRNKNSKENAERKTVLSKCWKYLDDMIKRVPDSDTVDSVQNNNKVRFLEIDYRKAQLLDVQGMLCYIVGVPLEKIKYFSEVSELMKQYFDKVDRLMQLRARFNYPWYSICPYALAEFATGHFERASELLLSVPKEHIPFGFYKAARNLLDRMLPYFSLETLFQKRLENMHAIIKYPLSDEIKQKIQSLGFDMEKMTYKARVIYAKQEPVGLIEFVYLLAQIYFSGITKQEYSAQQESIKILRSVVSMYAHYTPEFDAVLITPDDRIKAFYSSVVHKAMTPSRKRNKIEQQVINSACAAIFKTEMLAAIGK